MSKSGILLSISAADELLWMNCDFLIDVTPLLYQNMNTFRLESFFILQPLLSLSEQRLRK